MMKDISLDGQINLNLSHVKNLMLIWLIEPILELDRQEKFLLVKKIGKNGETSFIIAKILLLLHLHLYNLYQ